LRHEEGRPQEHRANDPDSDREQQGTSHARKDSGYTGNAIYRRLPATREDDSQLVHLEAHVKFLFGGVIGRFLSLAVLAVIVAGAGWYFFIREDNEAQKSAADITEDVRQAGAPAAATPTAVSQGSTTGPAASDAGTSTYAGKSYRVIEGQSEAWYLAPEKLASLPTSSTAKGTITSVTGEFHLTADGLDGSKPTTFTVDLTTLRSDESRRDNRAQGALETSKYPTTTFTATSISGLPAEFGPSDAVLQLTGVLDLHGVQKEVTWELKVKRDGDILSVLGTTGFKYSDFGITKPDIGGFVSVDENVTLQVQLFVQEG
jgi:polyisoprenoid-binding protein YceI